MRVAVIGTGIMGTAMVLRLLEAGHEVNVYNRTEDKLAPLVDAGAHSFDTPAAAAKNRDVVITCVTNGEAMEDVTFDFVDGVWMGLGKDAVHCDMSTIDPATAQFNAHRYWVRGERYVQAPVLGSRRQIEQGVLLVLAGGAEENIERCLPVWAAFSQRHWTFPDARQSCVVKLACNTLIAQMIVGLGQSMAIAAAAGVDPAAIVDILGNSALAAPMFAAKGKSIVDYDFAPSFALKHLLKDLRLASDFATDVSLPLPANAVNRELFTAAVARGLADLDYSAVVQMLIPKA
ncbi:MAG: NAD(P)-dependent oxidoreductase [Capsulimonadaceae bacterium]